MPIIYNSNFANSAGAAMREFKDVNKSYRNTMLKLEDQRLRQEENEARRAQAAQFQQDRLGQQQKQFDVQMDFKQQQLAGSRSRVGDQFAPPTGEGMLNLWGSMGELNASAVKDGRELITGEQQTAFGDQMSGLLGRQVTPDTPITAEELENHPNRRAIYRALTGQYNQMSTLDAQQRLTGSYEGTAQSLMESHPEFAQTPAGLAILDEMSAAYADALQEDELSPQAAAVEAQAFKRAYVAGATRMQDAADVRSDINKRLIETNTRGSRREAVNDILAQLNDPKSQLTADEVRLQALREFDPDSAAQFEAGQAQAAVSVAAAQAAGNMRNAPAPTPAANVPTAPATSEVQPSANGPSSAPRVVTDIDNDLELMKAMGAKEEDISFFQLLVENGVPVSVDPESGSYSFAPTDQTRQLMLKHYPEAVGSDEDSARRYEDVKLERQQQQQQQQQEDEEDERALLAGMDANERQRYFENKSLRELNREPKNYGKRPSSIQSDRRELTERIASPFDARAYHKPDNLRESILRQGPPSQMDKTAQGPTPIGGDPNQMYDNMGRPMVSELPQPEQPVKRSQVQEEPIGPVERGSAQQRQDVGPGPGPLRPQAASPEESAFADALDEQGASYTFNKAGKVVAKSAMSRKMLSTMRKEAKAKAAAEKQQAKADLRQRELDDKMRRLNEGDQVLAQTFLKFDIPFDVSGDGSLVPTEQRGKAAFKIFK